MAAAAADHLAAIAPSGVIGVSWGRTMIELAGRLQPGWTSATQIVQLNGAISRSAQPTRYQEVVERFGSTTGAAIQLMPAPAIVGTPELREALEADPSVAEPLEGRAPRRQRRLRHGRHGHRVSVHVASGYLDERSSAPLEEAGAVGDVLGRFITIDGRIALPSPRRAHGGPAARRALRQALTVGLAAGPGRGPIALGALRAACMKTLGDRRDHSRMGARA